MNDLILALLVFGGFAIVLNSISYLYLWHLRRNDLKDTQNAMRYLEKRIDAQEHKMMEKDQ